MTKVGPQPAEVTIIRAGYATERQWVEAIASARSHGRVVVSIDREGRRVSPASGEEDDW